mgnify:CR=1 FL=1|tara:strand:- start:2157 stop:2537 length:381 start_codon:yes stop_codon:yes gene_type:complete
MRFDDILNCKNKNCLNVADGINAKCLMHSQNEEGFKELKHERAELCNCGNEIGFYSPWGFAICDSELNTLATIEPCNRVLVICANCQRESDLKVEEINLPTMPQKSDPSVICLNSAREQKTMELNT